MRLLIAAIFLIISGPAHAEWWEAETAHFVVKSRASESQAREYALEMEKFDAALRTMFNLPTDEVETSRANKPTIYRFGRPKDMARIAGASGSGIGGFFIARAGDSVAFAPTRKTRDTSAKTSWQLRGDPRAAFDPRSVLLHEYTHYFMMQHFPSAYPRWYVEGFAEMMASARFDDDGSVHLGDPPQYRAAQIFQLQPFRMERMLDPSHELTGLDGLQHYATGWLLAHYLSFDSERQLQLRNYLQSIANGENGLEVARREFGDLNELDRKLAKYKKGPFPGRKISGVAFNTNVSMRELPNAEESAINLEMRLARGVRREGEAQSLAADLQSKIKNYPNSVHLKELLAAAQISARDFSGADQTAQQILSLDDTNVEAWLTRSYVAAKAAEDDTSMADKARDYATQASVNDRDDPRPLMAYYYSYIESRESVPETAAIALEQAFKKAGSDPVYRMLLGRQLLLESRLDAAEAVLLPIAFSGHKTREPKSEEFPTLNRVVDLIRADDRDGALMMVEQMMNDADDEEDTFTARL